MAALRLAAMNPEYFSLIKCGVAIFQKGAYAILAFS
jgi:hypothetical protein